MTSPIHFWDAVAAIRDRDGRYASEAYAFVMDALDFTIRRVGEHRHVTANELLYATCAFAKEQYGMLSYTMLERWGLGETGDIGEVVFQLVDAGVLSKRASDSRSEFDRVFDLRTTLEEEYFPVDDARDMG